MTKQAAVYILASKRNGTIYVGVTTNIIQRIWQHRNNQFTGFIQKYRVHSLVFFEFHESISQAIVREKQLKSWNRQWKLSLIEKNNPHWTDLWEQIIQ